MLGGLPADLLATPTPETEAALCRDLAPRLRVFALRHLRDDTAARDLVQEALVVVITAWRAGKIQGEAPRFAYGVAKNLISVHRRGDRRRGAALERISAVEAVVPPVEPIDHTRLLHCLNLLPARDRDVVLLTFRDDVEAAAIADQLAITANHVRVTRHRALLQLRDCMEGASA